MSKEKEMLKIILTNTNAIMKHLKIKSAGPSEKQSDKGSKISKSSPSKKASIKKSK